MKLPTFFISHGGGPWPWMPERKAIHHALEQSLRDMVATLPVTPQAVVMVSGHWEAAQVGVMSAANPPMEYDYYNFPPHTYEVTYPAPGNPALAESIVTMLASAGIAAVPDAGKGFDHGAFVPMHVMYPAADMPLVQVSMLQSYSPQAHVAMGRALAALREQGVLLVGSGLSYHNLRLMGPEAHTPSHAFDAWLHETLMLAPEARMQRVLHWEQAPHARVCHPREDHLVPLFVALGAAENGQAYRVYHEAGVYGGVTVSSYRFD
jgi:aromatic ring-opening dioxygenase catalytic subunit (LigB family)